MKTSQTYFGTLPLYTNGNESYIVAMTKLNRHLACNTAIFANMFSCDASEILAHSDLEPTEDMYNVIENALKTIADKDELNKFLLLLIVDKTRFISDRHFHFGESQVFKYYLSDDNRELLPINFPQWLIDDLRKYEGIDNFQLKDIFAYRVYQ